MTDRLIALLESIRTEDNASTVDAVITARENMIMLMENTSMRDALGGVLDKMKAKERQDREDRILKNEAATIAANKEARERREQEQQQEALVAAREARALRHSSESKESLAKKARETIAKPDEMEETSPMADGIRGFIKDPDTDFLDFLVSTLTEDVVDPEQTSRDFRDALLYSGGIEKFVEAMRSFVSPAKAAKIRVPSSKFVIVPTMIDNMKFAIANQKVEKPIREPKAPKEPKAIREPKTPTAAKEKATKQSAGTPEPTGRLASVMKTLAERSAKGIKMPSGDAGKFVSLEDFKYVPENDA
jgi:hypothetical protein